MVVKFPTRSAAANEALHTTISWLYSTANSLSEDALAAALSARLSEQPLTGDGDQDLIQWHLAQASAMCPKDTAARTDQGEAQVSLDGDVLAMDDAFKRFMQQAVPGWSGKKLPFQIFWTDSLPYHGMTFARLFIRVRATDDGYALVVREDQRASLLSRREQEVARLIADGQTFKQVGETLGLAISTVSTHLYRVYEKVGVDSRSDLVQWMREQQAAD